MTTKEDQLAVIFNAIEECHAECIEILRDAVAIKSVSTTADLRPEVRRMAEWLSDWMMSEFPDSKVKLQEMKKKQITADGTELEFPPLLLAEIGCLSSEKKTLLIYGHYDVVPAKKADGWETEPFELTVLENGEMRGRGATDDKGPLIGWISMLKCYKNAGIAFPVNIKFCLEGMEESNSLGFDETARHVAAESDFFEGIDFCCISDNYWLSTHKPCLTYGLRGLTSCQVTITGPSHDLHSGLYGGQVYQPIDDLWTILGTLKDNNEQILIEGVTKDVKPVTPEEEALYKDIYCDFETRKREIGVDRLREEESKMRCLMQEWRFPSLTLHGIEGAFSDSGFKSVIPRRVTGKFSIRTVPDMHLPDVEECIRKHLLAEFEKLKSPNSIKIHILSGACDEVLLRWYVDPKSFVFEAARKATRRVHGVDPDFTRAGGSIPPTVVLTEVTGRDVCLLPIGRCDDGAHSQNEKLDISNFIKGMKTFAAFLYELV